MKRHEQHQINATTIQVVASMISPRLFPLPYLHVVTELNAKGYRTSRGNEWTSKRLFRMLQRNGIGGLHGLKKSETDKTRALTDSIKGY